MTKQKEKPKKKSANKEKTKPAKKVMGRPSKFDTIDMDQVKKLALVGFTDKQFAHFYDVSLPTWKNWKKNNKDFLASLKDWKKEADEKVEKTLLQRALGYEVKESKVSISGKTKTVTQTTKQVLPDPTSIIFWLKNRRPDEWKDRRDNTITGVDNAPVLAAIELVVPKV